MKRKGLIVALALLLVLGGGWFYFYYFVATDKAVQRAEAFRFRRMSVAQLSGQGTYRHFFVTNRQAETEGGPVKDRFGRERQDDLTFGRFDTRIEPTVGLGMLINPSQWFQDEEIQLDNAQLLDRETFVETVRDVVDESPHRALLIVIHGFRERFPSALRKTAFVGHILDINAPILLFDWPGNQGSSLRGYRQARQVAEASGAELAETIRLIDQEIQPERLWLIANSMGAQVVVDAFSLLYADPDLADTETEIEDVVLTAPDVDHADLNERFKDEITALADELTVYVSSNDRALLISRLVNRSRRAGESTLSPDQLLEASRIAELVEPENDRITLVDVTPVNRTRNFHNFSLETPEFFDDLFLRLTNPTVPRTRLVYQFRMPDGRTYYVLTRGR